MAVGFWSVVKNSGSFEGGLLDLYLHLEAWLPPGVGHMSHPHQLTIKTIPTVTPTDYLDLI